MKKIEAMVRKERFSTIDEALKKIGVGGLTYFEVEGRGRAKGEEMVLTAVRKRITLSTLRESRLR